MTTNATVLPTSLTANGVEIPTKEGRVCFGQVLVSMGYKDPGSMMPHCLDGSELPRGRVIRESTLKETRYWVTPADAISLFRGYMSLYKPRQKRLPLIAVTLDALRAAELLMETPRQDAPTTPPSPPAIVVEAEPVAAPTRRSMKEDGAALAAELADDAAPLPNDPRVAAIQESLPFVVSSAASPVVEPRAGGVVAEVLPPESAGAVVAEFVPVLPQGTREVLFEGWLLAAREAGAAPLVLDLELGRRAGKVKPHDIRVTIKNLIDQGELEGIFATTTKNPETEGERRGRPGTAYWLTFAQALIVLTQLKTPLAREVRKEMSHVYEAWSTNAVSPAVVAAPALATASGEWVHASKTSPPSSTGPTVEQRIQMAQFEAQAADALQHAGADPLTVAQLRLRAAHTATGRSTAAFAPPTSIYIHTPEAMATHYGTSAPNIGKVAGALGLKGNHSEGLPGMSEAYRDELGDGRMVVRYRYSDAARRKIADALAKERTGKAPPASLPARANAGK